MNEQQYHKKIVKIKADHHKELANLYTKLYELESLVSDQNELLETKTKINNTLEAQINILNERIEILEAQLTGSLENEAILIEASNEIEYVKSMLSNFTQYDLDNIQQALNYLESKAYSVESKGEYGRYALIIDVILEMYTKLGINDESEERSS